MSSPVPSIEQCLEFIERYAMLDNIRAHSFKVAQVAETLVAGLQQAQKAELPLPDRDTVLAGALLHDIAKTRCLNTDRHHALEGQKICIELGYPEIGEMVAEHVILTCFRDDLYRRGLFSAKEIIYYSDKRVRHDQVVPLASRLDYILARYGDNNPAKEKLIHLNFNRTLRFEEYLFNFLPFSPDELEQRTISGDGEVILHLNGENEL